MWCRLAGHLKKTLRECMTQVDAWEFKVWEEFFVREPFGLDWMRTGVLCSLVANFASGGKSRYPAEDFYPVRPPPREQSPEDVVAIFRQLQITQKLKLKGLI